MSKAQPSLKELPEYRFWGLWSRTNLKIWFAGDPAEETSAFVVQNEAQRPVLFKEKPQKQETESYSKVERHSIEESSLKSIREGE
ncbi:MAG TPA: hypothetical protein VJ044_03255 [Candidatus Hodarchaeales archaeon]|nr:hypothetical protein [Candidatus Hodarchaeales archaeon]